MKCSYCPKELSKDVDFSHPNYLNWDHAIPQIHFEGNRVPSCRSCNSSKGTLTAEEFETFVRTRGEDQVKVVVELSKSDEYQLRLHGHHVSLNRRIVSIIDRYVRKEMANAKNSS